MREVLRKAALIAGTAFNQIAGDYGQKDLAPEKLDQTQIEGTHKFKPKFRAGEKPVSKGRGRHRRKYLNGTRQNRYREVVKSEI